MTDDLFGNPDPDDETRRERDRIIAEIERSPDNASVSALERHYAERMIGWRDGTDHMKRDAVILIRNMIRYRRHILRYFGNGRTVR